MKKIRTIEKAPSFNITTKVWISNGGYEKAKASITRVHSSHIMIQPPWSRQYDYKKYSSIVVTMYVETVSVLKILTE